MERAARVHEYGPPEVLRIEPIDAPPPGPGEALIRHTAIGLNFVEVYFAGGDHRPHFRLEPGDDERLEVNP